MTTAWREKIIVPIPTLAGAVVFMKRLGVFPLVQADNSMTRDSKGSEVFSICVYLTRMKRVQKREAKYVRVISLEDMGHHMGTGRSQNRIGTRTGTGWEPRAAQMYGKPPMGKMEFRLLLPRASRVRLSLSYSIHRQRKRRSTLGQLIHPALAFGNKNDCIV